MRTVVVAVVLFVLAPGRSEAQGVARSYVLPTQYAVPINTSPMTPVASRPGSIPSTAPFGRISVATVGGTYIPPYSYTVVPNYLPARHYQGYGGNDFPFYGRAYGRVYDPWTWTSLQGGYYNTLARYYYPPLGP